MKALSNILKSDIYDIISDGNIPWVQIKDSAVLVTGATGLIGSALIRALSAANAEHKLNICIIAHGRDFNKGEIISQECGAQFIAGDIRRQFPKDALPPSLEYIFHCAASTKSADMIAKPADVITIAVDGARNMLELAKERRCRSFMYLSSMEVYGQTALHEVSESDLGYLDLSNPRSCYPESKRLCEALCVAYAAQHGIQAKIARLAQTFGAGTPKDDPRVFAQFARSVVAGDKIKLHTEGKSRGNYCYTADAIRGLLYILFNGTNGEAYNIANPDASVTIREMAEIVATKVCGMQNSVIVNVPKDIAKRGYATDAGFILNADKLKALGWAPRYGLEEMYRRMLEDYKYH